MDGKILPKLEPQDGENAIQTTNPEVSNQQRINYRIDDSIATIANIKYEIKDIRNNTQDKGFYTNNSFNVNNSIIKTHPAIKWQPEAPNVLNNYPYFNEPNFMSEDTPVTVKIVSIADILRKCDKKKTKQKGMRFPTKPKATKQLRPGKNKMKKKFKNIPNPVVKVEILSSDEDEVVVKLENGLSNVNNRTKLDVNAWLKQNDATGGIDLNKTIAYELNNCSEKHKLNANEDVMNVKVKEEIESDTTNPRMETRAAEPNEKKKKLSRKRTDKIEIKDDDIDIEETKLDVDLLASVKRESRSSGPRYARWRNQTTGGIFDLEENTPDEWEDLQEEEEFEAEVAAAQLEVASAPVTYTGVCACDVLLSTCGHRPQLRRPRWPFASTIPSSAPSGPGFRSLFPSPAPPGPGF